MSESLNNTVPHASGTGEYVEVVLPLPLQATFTYSVPEEMRKGAQPGFRVVVPFGRRKFYTGIVVGLPASPPDGVEVKPIVLTLDSKPVVRHPQVKLWEWLADYYLCAVGDVYKAAIPSGLKIESETFVEINPDFNPETDYVAPPNKKKTAEETPGLFADDDSTPARGSFFANDDYVAITQLLDHEKQLSVAEIQKRIDRPGIAAAVTRLINIGAIVVSEKLIERYVTKKIDCVRLSCSREELPAAFAAVKGAPKQETLLLALVELSGIQQGAAKEVTRAALLERSGVSGAILSALVKKGVAESYRKEVNRFRFDGRSTGVLPTLSDAQKTALDAIHKSWADHEVTLLHGVTSSGKTEIYIHLIDYVLRRGDQALFLVPEIALTTQLTRRLQEVFGEKVVIYHSKFSDNERVDIWRKLLDSQEPCVVIGARSSVFLPFGRLGLVIVDEEHESSYKQFDPAPRYNARDAAMVLARMHGARTLLGSATPAIETYYKAQTGKFGLVELNERYGNNVRLPHMRTLDLKTLRQSREMRGALGTPAIVAARHSLAAGRQVIFFQNRRGFAPIARCKKCAWTPKCDNCDVALTYHRSLRQLRCHYCGATYPLPQVCPQCKEPAIEVLGYGTERIEDEVGQIFPEWKVLRMDLDSTRNKSSYEQIIDDFSSRKANILVGTQMVTKGLDFEGVETVCVVSADSLINQPDFRSGERAFNMLEQVAGRAGRRDGQQGQVLIQTSEPAHPVLSYVLAHDYRGFYEHEIAERQRFFYPPFCRIIYVYIKHRDQAVLRNIADVYAQRLRELFGGRVFGPDEPAVARIQGFYIRRIMLKIEPSASMTQVKSLLRGVYVMMNEMPPVRRSIIYYDVDPQ